MLHLLNRGSNLDKKACGIKKLIC